MKSLLAAKPAVIAALALVLFVPVDMIQHLVAERAARRDEAVAGIAHGWGARQTLAGPYLAVPYERTRFDVARETVNGEPRVHAVERTESMVLRLPAESVTWELSAQVSEKARGIYKARLYTVTAMARGRLAVPENFGLSDPGSRIKWGTPRFVVGVSDPGGIRGVSALVVGGAEHDFVAGSADAPRLSGGVHAMLPELSSAHAQALPFSFDIEIAGAEAFSLAPIGADASVAMRSSWPHPSFTGRFLPVQHAIGPDGFTARWTVSRYAAPDVWGMQALAVSFVEPASLYRKLARASKYGFLFIGLTFGAFLLFELLRRLAIHPVQYAFVGLALAIFFLLLTALSEYIPFAAAYALAAAACVGLITTYLIYVLRNPRIALAFGAALGGLYAMLYALLQAEDYSLLGGALLLFVLLAGVMIATRRIDWYGLTSSRTA
jgi:inner membrane protein